MIGIVSLNHDTFTNPTLCHIIEKLGEKNLEVILYCDNRDSKIPNGLKNITYADAPSGVIVPRRPGKLISYLQSYRKVLNSIKKNKIKRLIAVDPPGLVIAGRLKTYYPKLEIHYCSFEILFKDELKNDPSLLKLKASEIKYSKKLSSIIIQDTARQELLVAENNLGDFKNWHLIPVAPIINAQTRQKKYSKSDFGLKESDIVYVHTGSVAAWSGINSIIETIENGLPENSYILIHNKTEFHPDNEVFIKLKSLKAEGKNIIIHDKVFENYDDYLNFLKCFDYGIVIYVPDDGIFTGMNIKEIGLSSGKFSAFLSQGIPVLLSPCKSYRSILENYRIGALITAENDLNYHILNESLKTVDRKICTNFFETQLKSVPQFNQFIAQFTS